MVVDTFILIILAADGSLTKDNGEVEWCMQSPEVKLRGLSFLNIYGWQAFERVIDVEV
jgi:hypothetical protein